MTIDKKINGDKITFAVSGRLDTMTAPQLEAELDASLGGCSDLIFDLAGLDYISSAGLRIILKTQKAMNRKGSMKLINVKEPVMDVFDITGFVDILTIE